MGRVKPDSPAVRRSKQHKGGPVLFQNLPAGTYYIQATQGDRTKNATLTFPGALAEVHLDLTDKRGTIIVSVFWGSGAKATPANGATVQLGGTRRKAPAFSNKVKFWSLEAGKYLARATATDDSNNTASGQSKEVDLKEGAVAPATVYLKREKQTRKTLRAEDKVRDCVVHPDEPYMNYKEETANWLTPWKHPGQWEPKIKAEFDADEARIKQETKSKLISKLNAKRDAIEKKYSPDKVEFELEYEKHEWKVYQRKWPTQPEIEDDTQSWATCSVCRGNAADR